MPTRLLLALDIGGTGLKAALVDARGRIVGERLRVATPAHPSPRNLIPALKELVAPLKGYDRVAAGFPGVIRRGIVLTSPTLENAFDGFALEKALRAALGKPVRAVNDAEMQGFATIKGKGIELVVTLGTGFGSALFADGRATPHLELSTHPLRHGESYNEQLGEAARKRVGRKKWNQRVEKAVATLFTLTHFDHLYLGGGNSARVDFTLPKNVSLASNANGLRGGAWVWK